MKSSCDLFTISGFLGGSGFRADVRNDDSSLLYGKNQALVKAASRSSNPTTRNKHDHSPDHSTFYPLLAP